MSQHNDNNQENMLNNQSSNNQLNILIIYNLL